MDLLLSGYYDSSDDDEDGNDARAAAEEGGRINSTRTRNSGADGAADNDRPSDSRRKRRRRPEEKDEPRRGDDGEAEAEKSRPSPLPAERLLLPSAAPQPPAANKKLRFVRSRPHVRGNWAGHVFVRLISDSSSLGGKEEGIRDCVAESMRTLKRKLTSLKRRRRQQQ